MVPPVSVEDDAARVEALIERCPVGGLLLFNGRWPTTPDVLAHLQDISPYPLLVGADIERGVGQQVQGGTLFPHAMAFARVGDDSASAVESFARVTALEARACGIHLSFSPVADVQSHPKNPIIGIRAFGNEPESTARHVTAYIRGAQAEGLLTTAKHFPGHGRTHTDTHATLPTIDASRDALYHQDLVPFRAAVEAGAEAIMTAHIAYPALDDQERPATASPLILIDLLRKEMGFEGVVVSDSLLMEGVRDTHDTPGEQAAALVRAGVDVLLDPEDPDAVVDGLARAVHAGRLDEARLDEAFARVWWLKEQMHERWGASAFERTLVSQTDLRIGQEVHHEEAKQVARRAVQFTAGRSTFSAPGTANGGEGLLVIQVEPRERPEGSTEPPLAHAVRAVYPKATYRSVDARTSREALGDLCNEASAYETVVVALVVVPAAWRAFGLSEAQHTFVQTLTEQQAVILASLGSPHALDEFEQAITRVCTYSDVHWSQEALVDFIRTHAEQHARP